MTKRHYTRDQQKYLKSNAIKKLLLKNFLKKLNASFRKIPSPGEILDIGCGEGFVIGAISTKNKIPYLVGTDIEKEVLFVAKKRFPQYQFLQSTITHLPFADDSFDVVFATEILEHIHDYEKALAELQRVCRAYCLISVPREPFFAFSNFLRLRNVMRLGKDEEHVNFWGKKRIQQIVSAYFDIQEIQNPFPWTILLCKVKD